MRKALYILGSLDDADIVWLVRNGAARWEPAGARLIREGEQAASLYILLEGELSVDTAVGGHVATMAAGEVAGEISFIDSRPPTATVTTSRDSLLLEIPRESLRTKLDKDSGFASHFYRALAVFLAERLRSTMNKRVGRTDDSEEMDPGMIDSASRAANRFRDMVRMVRGSEG